MEKATCILWRSAVTAGCRCWRQSARGIYLLRNSPGSGQYAFQLVGYVVMLNHIHLLMSEPRKGTPSTVIQMLKQRVSRKMRKRTKRISGQREFQFDEDGLELKSFWQERFYDFNVYKRGKIKEKLDYMHANPVIRGLVEHPKNWPWSSWSFYFESGKGFIAIDTAEF